MREPSHIPAGERPPLCARLLLPNPRQIRRNLDALVRAGRIDRAPTLWQVFTGVLYLWHRILFRPETIGYLDPHPAEGSADYTTRRAGIGEMDPSAPLVRRLAHGLGTWARLALAGPGDRATDRVKRATSGARRMERRLARLRHLFRERAVRPLDFTGLAGTVPDLEAHAIGCYHAGDKALYDLEILAAHPGALGRFRARVAAIVDGTDPRAEYWKDLAVYEGYHADLLALCDRAVAGDFGPPPAPGDNPDATLGAFLAWCRAQPATPGAFARAFVRGQLDFTPRLDAAAAEGRAV